MTVKMGNFRSDQLIAAYIRVSTVEQNEGSQREAIRGWLKGNGIPEERVLWYTDTQTGDNLQRPGFERMRQAVFEGKVGTVVVFKLDRISRKQRDGINVLADWLEHGVRVVSVTQQMDFSGVVGGMVAGLLFAVAEMEQETRRERQAAGIELAKREGKYLGRKRGTFKADPGRARELREKGLSMAEIGNALGVSKMAVSRYLRQGV